jgi:hypothetical protein
MNEKFEAKYQVRGDWSAPPGKPTSKIVDREFKVSSKGKHPELVLNYILSSECLPKKLGNGRHLHKISGGGFSNTMTICDGVISFVGSNGDLVGRGLVNKNLKLSLDVDCFPEMKEAEVRRLFLIVLKSEVVFYHRDGFECCLVKLSSENVLTILGDRYSDEQLVILVLISMALFVSGSLCYISS